MRNDRQRATAQRLRRRRIVTSLSVAWTVGAEDRAGAIGAARQFLRSQGYRMTSAEVEAVLDMTVAEALFPAGSALR